MADLIGTGNTGLNTAAIPQALFQWDSLVEPAATRYGLDPALIYAVMQEESGGNPNALSSAGAIGLMQVMPFNDPNGNLYDPTENIDVGCSILASDIASWNGDLNQALQSYNGGSYRDSGTANYAATVIALYGQYSAGNAAAGGAGASGSFGPPAGSGTAAPTPPGLPDIESAWSVFTTNVNQLLPALYSAVIQMRGTIGSGPGGGAGRYQ